VKLAQLRNSGRAVRNSGLQIPGTVTG
jgi:hypothetical protein